MHLGCILVFAFGFQHKQCADDKKNFSFVNFIFQLFGLVALMSP